MVKKGSDRRVNQCRKEGKPILAMYLLHTVYNLLVFSELDLICSLWFAVHVTLIQEIRTYIQQSMLGLRLKLMSGTTSAT